MGQLSYKGYRGSVEFSAEDNCLYGKVQGIKGTLISYEGETVEEIKKDFEDAVDFYLESCKERGLEPIKPYSGKLLLRMPSDLHRKIANAATKAGIPINDFINRTLSKEVSPV